MTHADNRIEEETIVPAAQTKLASRAINVKSSAESITPAEAQRRVAPHADEVLAAPRPKLIDSAVLGSERNTESSHKNAEAARDAESPIQIAQSINLEQTTLIEHVTTTLPPVVPIPAAEKAPREPAPPEALVVKPQVSTDRTEVEWSEPEFTAAEAPPSVRITIGRVDVRAVMPPSPARTVKSAARKALSLDDYLKQRSGEPR
jgi:hypothetical protein